jgi:hypothetical protein
MQGCCRGTRAAKIPFPYYTGWYVINQWNKLVFALLLLHPLPPIYGFALNVGNSQKSGPTVHNIIKNNKHKKWRGFTLLKLEISD